MAANSRSLLTVLTMALTVLLVSAMVLGRRPEAARGASIGVAESGFSVTAPRLVTYGFIINNPRAAEVFAGSGFLVEFLDAEGRVVGSDRWDLPLVFPGKVTAIGQDDVPVAESPTRMRVSFRGGNFEPLAGLTPFEPSPNTSAGGGALGGPATFEGAVVNPYDFAVSRVYIAAIIREPVQGQIVGGASREIDGIEGASAVPVTIRMENGPRAPFAANLYASTFSDLGTLVRAAATEAAQPTPSPPRITWVPAELPRAAAEAAEPLRGRAADLTWAMAGLSLGGSAEMILETNKPVFALWPESAPAPFVSYESRGEDGSFLRGLLSPPYGGPSLVVGGNFQFEPSPDGSLVLVTESLPGGKVYLVDRAGAVRRLAGIDGPLYFLSWSPDSKWLALAGPTLISSPARAEGSVYTVPVQDGIAGVAARRLKLDVEAAWSPDSRRLALAPSGGQVEMYDNVSGELRILGAALTAAKPQWSSDGRLVSVGADVWEASRASRLFAPSADVGVIGGEVSPDMRRLVYTEAPSGLGGPDACPGPGLQNRTHLVDLASGSDRVILDCDQGFHYVVWWSSTRQWMSDSRHVVLPVPSCWACGGGTVGVDLLDTLTGRVTRLATAKGAALVAFAVSPGGDKVAVSGKSVDVFDAGGAAVFHYEPPPGKVAGSPVWSPDGSRLVVTLAPADFRSYE